MSAADGAYLPATSPMALAVAKFNEVFGYGIALPMVAEDYETMAELAALRGRQDIADLMREALEMATTEVRP